VRGQDYTATSGTSIASLAALTASDVIEILTFDSFSIADGILATTVDAKGDLIVGIANDTVGRVAVGTDGYFLKANSGVTGGVEWSTVPGAFAQISEPTSPSDGTVWIDTDGTAPTTVVTRWTEQPAAGTTVLTGNDDYSIPLAYSPGYEQVFLNGVLLSRSGSEYTATNGTSITLAAATVAGDIVEVICPLQIATTDTYTQSAVNNAFVANTGYFAAGKNKIINGDFSVWQRGTSFSSPSDDTYSSADRWKVSRDGSPTFTVSQQAATPAAITGYDPQYYLRYNVTSLGSATSFGARQRIEDVRTLAGQTVTVSFWIKSDATRAIDFYWQQNFGSGGSTTVTSSAISMGNATTSWQRLSQSFTITSISGKTIGAGNYLAAIIILPGATQTTDIWGVQLEAGSVATPFTTATGTIQGELAACQRYYWRNLSTESSGWLGVLGYYSSTTSFRGNAVAPVSMRTTPTSVDYSTISVDDGAAGRAVTAAAISTGGTWGASVYFTVASGGTANRPANIINNANTAGYIGLSAEL
jgi:hypothetical protein